MSDKKITQLPPLSNPSLADLLAIVNSSTTKKITLADLFKSFLDTGNLNLGFFLVPAGQVAPDGEFYYVIKPDSPVPIQEGEITTGTPEDFFSDAKSKIRVEHAVALPVLGWIKKQVDGQRINDILFTDRMNGFAVTASGKIYKSIDAGRSWTQKYSNGGTSPITAIDIDGLQQVRALASQPTANTTGTSFAVASTTAAASVQPAAARTTTIVAIGGTKFYYSSDLGETWTPTDISVNELQAGEQYISISSTSNPYYVLGNMGTIVKVAQSNLGIYSAQFISTLPAGGTYSAISAQVTGIAVPVGTLSSDLVFATGNVPLASGQAGKVFKSTDGAANFTEVFSVNGTNFYGLFFADFNNGWVCGGTTSGNFGMVYKTIDGGSTWTQKDLTSLPASALHDIHFGTDGIGWAVGENSTIVKSIDGGTTWTKDSEFITEQGNARNLLAVSAIFENIAYVAGDAGGLGNFYYLISDTINGVKYTYNPVDSIWIKVTGGGGIKQGFVAALDA